MNTLEKLSEAFKREQLAAQLAKCSQKQRELFARLYPDGVPSDKLNSAYDLVERTIKKNLANPDRLEPTAQMPPPTLAHEGPCMGDDGSPCLGNSP